MPAPSRRIAIGLAVVAIVVAVAVAWFVTRPAEGPRTAVPVTPAVVREEQCHDSEFTCITLRVPRDHFADAEGPTFDVTFGLLRASGEESRGAFVTVTGGPGSSGLAVADGYTGALDPAIPEEYDIIFFDQRGVGQSEPIQCPEASLAYYLSPTGPEDREAYAAEADRFTDACVAESGVDPEAFAYYSTRQAVEDLEVFRTWLGVEQIQLYGESYGTQYAQQYANAHPDRVAGLFLDGPVDLTVSGFDYYAEQTRSFADTLELTLTECADAPVCGTDTSGDPLEAYDALTAELTDAPTPFEFVTDQGAVEERDLTVGLFESAVATSVYSPTDRMLLLRALAYASRGELLPVARLGYLALAQDAETLEMEPDPSYSDAMYYAVECTDYLFPGPTEEERVAAFFAAADEQGMDELRLGSGFFGDLPCAYWPARPTTDTRPAALTDTPFPVWVLASTADPATPYRGAVRIYERLTNGYLIVQSGGPHVIFGRGDPCPDEPVTTYLLTGELPDPRRTDCSVDAVDPYIPIAAPSADDYADPLEAMLAVDDEINYSADFWYWSGEKPLALGCLNGGTLRYVASDDGYEVELTDCETSAGLPLTGDAVIDDTDGTFELSVTSADGTDLDYLRDADGGISVEGQFDGQPVSEEEPAA